MNQIGQVVMLDRAPQDAGVSVIRVAYRRLNAPESPALWVDIASGGTVTQDEELPDWWSGPAQPC
jgi:hypothetical protein